MYDAVVIGSGPAGYKCAEMVSELGGKAAIVEKGEYKPGKDKRYYSRASHPFRSIPWGCWNCIEKRKKTLKIKIIYSFLQCN